LRVIGCPRNQGNLNHIPKIALVVGDEDQLEDVLAKVGLAEEDGAYGIEWGTENFDLYNNREFEEARGAPLNNLWGNLPSYHVVMFACSYNAIFKFMEDPAKQTAIRNFVWNGGRLYVTDYAQPVVEMSWPEFIWHNDPLHGGCVENRFPDGCNHGPPFDAPATVKDDDMRAWLDAMGELDGLEIKENWNTIGDVFEGVVGEDPQTGAKIMREPKVWVEGPWSYDADDLEDEPDWDMSPHPMTVSFPYNCGKTLYTTYHTVGGGNGGRHPGLYGQELILFYLLMEVTVCPDIPIIK